MDSTEIKELLDILKDAYKRSIASGGVVQYSINSGQSQTMVKQASSTELLKQIKELSAQYEEATQIESGSNLNVIRDVNFNVFQQVL